MFRAFVEPDLLLSQYVVDLCHPIACANYDKSHKMFGMNISDLTIPKLVFFGELREIGVSQVFALPSLLVPSSI
jgi:hypothetical protein